MKNFYLLCVIVSILSCAENKSVTSKEKDTTGQIETSNQDEKSSSKIENNLIRNEEDIYKKFRIEKERVVEKLKSSTKTEANQLFLEYSKINQEIISEINEKEQILLSQFYSDDATNKKNIKELEAKLSHYQLRIEGIGEGEVIISTIPSFDYDIFKNYVTQDFKEYIFLISEESKSLYSADAGLSISFKQLGERIIYWESFVSKYPNFKLIDQVKTSLGYYRHDYIFGMENTMTFERDYESQTENNQKISYIYEENLKEFDRFINKYPNSPTIKPIKLFIQKHKEMQEKELIDLIDKEINKN
ncbi:MAG: hypothetical protein C4K58_06720 [Flavobacteriaceae bacterium]|nr:MAG: hypothetical protein C4K58_06720 [Flavobacteriaceae bacterium]